MEHSPESPAARPAPRDKMHWSLYVIAGVMAVMGLINLNDFRYALAAQKNWTPASGRITENRVVAHHGRKSTSYNTFISYNYGTNTSIYNSGQVEINKYRPYLTERGAQADLDKDFPPGKSVDVYYNPDNPYESSLGLAGAPGLQVPLVFFVLAFGIFHFAREQRS